MNCVNTSVIRKLLRLVTVYTEDNMITHIKRSAKTGFAHVSANIFVPAVELFFCWLATIGNKGKLFIKFSYLIICRDSIPLDMRNTEPEIRTMDDTIAK